MLLSDLNSNWNGELTRGSIEASNSNSGWNSSLEGLELEFGLELELELKQLELNPGTIVIR